MVTKTVALTVAARNVNVHSVVHTIPPDPKTLVATRVFTRDALTRWQLPDELIEAAVAVANELASNAIVHTRSAAELHLTLDDLLRIEVADSSRAPPRPFEAGSDGSAPRLGLVIVDFFADGWGYRPTPAGKTVWTELRT